MTVLAVDIGGSGSRAAVLTHDHEVVVHGPPLRRADGRAHIEEALEHLAAALPPIPREVSIVAIGAAGLMAMGDHSVVASTARSLWNPRKVVVASDITTSHLAVWRGEGGVVVAAGTGVTALGTDGRDLWIRADGWGHLVGDRGGGAWIGAQGIGAGLRHRDHVHGGSAPLLKAIEHEWGNAERVPALISRHHSPPSFLASFVPAVVAAAETGDVVSQHILRSAGRHLAATGLAVAVDGVPPRIALTGGIVHAGTHLTEAFAGELERQRPDVRLVLAESTALDGARWLAESLDRGSAPSDRPPYLTTYQFDGDTTWRRATNPLHKE